MKPLERGIGARVGIRFGYNPAKGLKGTIVGATIVGLTPKRVRLQRDNEKEVFTKKWSELL